MKILNLIFILLTFTCQSQNCECYGFIDWHSDKTIVIYSDFEGKNKIGELKNDIENEDILSVKFLDSKNNYFKVEMGYLISDIKKTGWIKKEKEVGTYVGEYSENHTVNLYSEPNINSKIDFSVIQSEPQFYSIIDCSKEWIYVRIKTSDKIYEGWIGPRMHCPSPYTTCG